VKRLLLISPFFHPNVGGVETRLLDLVRTLDKYGHQVEVLTYQPVTTGSRGLSRERLGGTTIRRIPWPGRDLFHRLLDSPVLEVLYLVPGLLAASFLFMLRHHQSIDTIHTPGLNAAIVGRLLKAVFGKRWVVSTHTIYGLIPETAFSRIISWVLKNADSIITLSEPSREELIGIGLLPDRIVTAMTWVNQDRFRPLAQANCRKKLGLALNDFIVLFVGRLIPEKGASVVADMARQMPEVRFLVVGTGSDEASLTKSVKLPNLTVTGYVPQETLPDYYNAADIFILPSLYREGLGRVVIEALSCGTPVLLSNLAAIGPLIEEAAFACPPEAHAMARQISLIRATPSILQEKRERTRPLAENLFGERNVHDLICAYGWETQGENR
jgi:glycosyltransferase involved in cell wall biosynthesis